MKAVAPELTFNLEDESYSRIFLIRKSFFLAIDSTRRPMSSHVLRRRATCFSAHFYWRYHPQTFDCCETTLLGKTHQARDPSGLAFDFWGDWGRGFRLERSSLQPSLSQMIAGGCIPFHASVGVDRGEDEDDFESLHQARLRYQ